MTKRPTHPNNPQHVRDYFQRQKDRGLVRQNVWVPAQYAADLRAYADLLKKKAREAGK